MTTIIYTWGVVRLECYPEVANLTDVVFTVHWTLSATDGTYYGSAYGSIGVPAPTGAFTPYPDLTEPQVIGWVHSAMGAEAVASYEAVVTAQIEAQVNPTVVTPPLPWAPPAVTPPHNPMNRG